MQSYAANLDQFLRDPCCYFQQICFGSIFLLILLMQN